MLNLLSPREILNEEKQWIISFSYVKTLTSLGAQWWGGGDFNNQTGPILVHI